MIRAVASMRQDEAIPKIDFSEEKCHGKCLKSTSEPLDLKKYRNRNLPRLVLKSGDYVGKDL